ncbi:related to small s protein [Fusarium fujikuroi]|nr:related to small s protein [Fusarium fujikuroi]
MSAREDGIDDAHNDTLAWTLDPSENGDKSSDSTHRNESASNAFSSWLRGSGESIFWISGKAGSGKSTMMKWLSRQSQIQQALKYWAGGSILLRCHHFFSVEGGNFLQKPREGMLRSIIVQLLRAQPSLAAVVYPELFTPERLSAPIDSAKFPMNHLSWSGLLNAVQKIIAHAGKSDWKICMFIDGLDEYRNIKREDRYTEAELDMLNDGDDSGNYGRDVETPISTDQREIVELLLAILKPWVRLCMSSRELNIFESTLAKFPRLRMQEHNKADILKYTWSKLSRPEWDQVDKTSFVQEVVDMSCGVFLWVRLVVDILIDSRSNGDTAKQLREELRKTPVQLCGPKGLYMKMMSMVRHDYLQESARIFQLVLGANNPLDLETAYFSLSFFEGDKPNFQPALSMETSVKESLDMSDVNAAFRRKIKSRCGGLLDDDSQHLKFMHNTAREFIIRPSTWKRLERIFDEENFEVPHALLAGLIVRVKSGPEYLRLRPQYEHVPDHYAFVTDAMHFAYIVDGKTRYKPEYVELVDTLDQAMTKMVEAAYPQNCRCGCRCAWPTFEPMESGACDIYDTFFCYAARGGLSTYLDAKLSGMSLPITMAQKVLAHYSKPVRGGIPMLCFSGTRYIPINYPYGDPNVARVLLKYGADPKLVWESFLRQGYYCFGRGSNGIYPYFRAHVDMQAQDQRRWIDVLKLFLEHGADPTVVVKRTYLMTDASSGKFG